MLADNSRFTESVFMIVRLMFVAVVIVTMFEYLYFMGVARVRILVVRLRMVVHMRVWV